MPEDEPLLEAEGDEEAGAAPASLLCPITQEVMVEPVIAADGFTYERAAIERWLEMGPNRRSPTTNAPLGSRTLTPNRHLASMIAAYRSRLGARVVEVLAAPRAEGPDAEAHERAAIKEVATLLEAGADANARDDDGRPALLIACRARRFGVARLLVEHGARVSAADGTSESLDVIERHIEAAVESRDAARTENRRRHLGKLLEDPGEGEDEGAAADVENPLHGGDGASPSEVKDLLTDSQLESLRTLVETLRERAEAEVADDERAARRRREAEERRATNEAARDSENVLRTLADRNNGGNNNAPGGGGQDAPPGGQAGVFGAARLRQRGFFPSIFALQFGLVPDRRRGRTGQFKWTCFAFLEDPQLPTATHRERVAMRRMRAAILSVGTLLFFFLCFG